MRKDLFQINGSPKLEFETDDDRSYFVTRFFIHPEFFKKLDKQKVNEVSEADKKMKEV